MNPSTILLLPLFYFLLVASSIPAHGLPTRNPQDPQNLSDLFSLQNQTLADLLNLGSFQRSLTEVSTCYVDRLRGQHLNIFNSSTPFRDVVELYYKTFPENRLTRTSMLNLLDSTGEIVAACLKPDRKSEQKLGYTPLSDQSHEDMRRLSSSFPSTLLGGAHSKRDSLSDGNIFSQDDNPDCSTANILSLPDTFDWRTRGVVTPVKHQKGCGSCWVFAAVASIESAMLIHNLTDAAASLDLAEEQFVRCTNGCRGGSSEIAFDYVLKNGITFERDLPYLRGRFGYYGYRYGEQEQDDEFCNAQSSPNIERVYPLRGFCVQQRDTPLSDLEIQRALVKFGPLYLSMSASYRNNAGGIIDDPYCPKSDYSQNHAVLLVGYTPQVWILKNCWGTSYGDDGYLQVARGRDQNICGINSEMAWPLVTTSKANLTRNSPGLSSLYSILSSRPLSLDFP